MKRMLINATHTDEIRVAIADGQKLYDLDIDSAGHYRKKGNIYKARITRVEPSLEACFVNYGSERHGFLPYKEISPAYCKQAPRGKARLPINQAVKEGDEIIVQVNKEERGNKGAALSTFISLAGRYLVYMPGNHRAGGISRQIRGEKRNQLQEIMRKLEIPKNDGVIIRTAGLGRNFEELQWDFNYLKQVWEAIGTAANQKKGPFFIYQESDLFIRALRDYLQPDIGEILIDDRESFEKAREFMQQVMPHNLKKLSHYNDSTPLFSRYQIERQIQSAFEREVKLPSGGALVIDQTEALLSIDINSAKATKGIDVETTALNTNLEAADEIARQLKIRDLGGLVVIDFIDMRNHKNQRAVENRMRDAADSDRARVQIGKISKFGLLEMSRQRLRSSISDSSQITCPTCGGHGFIRSMDSLVISIIRLTEEEMIKPKTGRVVIQAPVETTNKILNEKRTELSEMEATHGVQVSVISNDNLSFPDFHVQRLNTNEAHISVDAIELVKPEDCHKTVSLDPPAPTAESPALRMVKPNIQAPKRSVFATLSNWFKNLLSKSESAKPKNRNNKQNHKKKPYRKNTKGGHKNQQNKPKGGQNNHNKNQQKTGTHNNKQHHGPNKHQQNKQQQAKKQNNQQNKQQHGGQKKSPNNQQQPNKQNNNNNQQHNKQQPNKQNQNNQNNQENKQQNNQNKNNRKTTKSIYGNKNQNRNKKAVEKVDELDSNSSADNNTAKIMTRPLGSVADLAAKKATKVPSGANKPRPIDNIDVKEQSTQGQAVDKKPVDKNSVKNKPVDKKPVENKSPENKVSEDKTTNDMPLDNKAAENKSAQTKAAQTKAVNKKSANNSLDKPTENKSDDQMTTKKPATKKTSAKKSSPKKATAKKATAKKTVSKKATTKKATDKKATDKKTTVKKTDSDQKDDKDSVTKKSVTKNNDSKKADSKKAVSKKTTTKKTTAKKTTAKKTTAKKTSSKKPVKEENSENAVNKKAEDNQNSKSTVTAQMIKPGLYKAKKSD